MDNCGRTIAAVSTAYGESGIGIVRMSGPDAKKIASGIFVPAARGERGKKGFEFIPRHMHYGSIKDPSSKAVLDEVLCVYMKAPRTYTGEDMVEIQCHGSAVSLRQILALCLAEGADPAERGEFTKLAFLNGRIDLAQAEAVIDLIKARTNRSFDAALSQMRGTLSEKVRAVRSELLELLVLLTVNMDYPDEDIERASYEKIEKSLSSIHDKLCNLLKNSEEGRILRQGLGIAIVGKPNVGKSTLMNAFLGEGRSIVTDIPGTTRDTIEEQISLRGIPLRITDTAGIRDSDDPVEAIGIERSKEALGKADLALLLFDSSRPLSKEDEQLLEMAQGRPCIAVLNKNDLDQKLFEKDISDLLPSAKIVSTSLIDDEGAEAIKRAVEELVFAGSIRREEDILVSNVRHIQLIKDALRETQEAIAMTRRGEAMDFIEVNANAAFSLLGEISGDTASAEIIDEVFERFCLGK